MAELSQRQILAGKLPARMHGLDELFDELYEQGRRPDEGKLGAELVERARAHNYIPKVAVEDYAQALRREYHRYTEQQANGCTPQPVDYGTWRGLPREQVPWFPTVAVELCTGCGVCLDLCKYGVLAPTPDDGVKVVEPFKCVVGCNFCATICKPKAITFPPLTILDAFRPG